MLCRNHDVTMKTRGHNKTQHGQTPTDLFKLAHNYRNTNLEHDVLKRNLLQNLSQGSWSPLMHYHDLQHGQIGQEFT